MSTQEFLIADKDKVTQTEFYKLIELDVLSTGQAYLDAVKNDLVSENLWEYVTDKVVAVVTDSANNMVGSNNGFVTLFKREINKPSIITQNCLFN